MLTVRQHLKYYARAAGVPGIQGVDAASCYTLLAGLVHGVNWKWPAHFQPFFDDTGPIRVNLAHLTLYTFEHTRDTAALHYFPSIRDLSLEVLFSCLRRGSREGVPVLCYAGRRVTPSLPCDTS